jgi:hypothetical protein
MGVTSVIMGSAVDLDGESMRDFFIGKAEAKTSHNCLPEMVAVIQDGGERNPNCPPRQCFLFTFIFPFL